DEESGVVRAHLTTALPLEEKQAAPFIAYLKARLGGEVKLTREVDPELIAGFRLSWRDKVIDGSVARSIQEIRRRLSA
ncbi:MAG TPA: F0F1 ATP synthase subunit delta, partial [Bacteroidetes bacterium]|nr:F0F1 ATP synthase subunit delta [Bacteroidota bacterium]